MKNLIITFVSFAISTSVLAAQDSTNLRPSPGMNASIRICEKDPQKVTLIVTNPACSKFTIDVYSKKQGYLFSQVITKADYRANLDFSPVGDGDYTVEVSCRSGQKFLKTINI